MPSATTRSPARSNGSRWKPAPTATTTWSTPARSSTTRWPCSSHASAAAAAALDEKQQWVSSPVRCAAYRVEATGSARAGEASRFADGQPRLLRVRGSQDDPILAEQLAYYRARARE